nr:hypothetical protein [Tanacetum cinerariifolium]
QQSLTRSWINFYPTVELYTSISSPGHGSVVGDAGPDAARALPQAGPREAVAGAGPRAAGDAAGLGLPRLRAADGPQNRRGHGGRRSPAACHTEIGGAQPGLDAPKPGASEPGHAGQYRAGQGRAAT